MRWEKMQGGGSGPGKRWGHTCNAVGGGRLLYVVGGYGKDKCQTNQVHVFDTLNGIWTEPITQGLPPVPRDSHSCTTVGDNLFLFGGTDGRNPLNDLHVLDTTSNTWYSPTVRGEAPEAREGHSAALVGKRLFIFGGCGKTINGEIYYHDLYILNVETFVWKRVVPLGTPPSKRDSHTVSSYKNRIIVIGGEDSHDYYLSDVHMLDTDTLIWCKINPTGIILPPRAGHTTVAFDKHLFVFGGFSDEQNLYDDVFVLNMEVGLWSKVTTTGEGPSARFSMAGECLDPQMGGVLVFFGGCNRNLEALDDMYYLHTGLVKDESTREDRRFEKLSLRKQLKMKCQEQNAIIPSYDNILYKVPVHGYLPPGGQDVYLNRNENLSGKRAFKAKITQNLPQGYTIETVLDGKPLHGVLFSTQAMMQNMNIMQGGGTQGKILTVSGQHTTTIGGTHENVLPGTETQTMEQNANLMQAKENILTETGMTRDQNANVMQTEGVHANILTGNESDIITGVTIEKKNEALSDVPLTQEIPNAPNPIDENEETNGNNGAPPVIPEATKEDESVTKQLS